jgi:hypothetical protein
MKSDILISDVVDTREVGKDVIEICANVDGHYDRTSSLLEIKQDAFLRNHAGEQFRPSWLPQGETIREHLPHEEIQELGRSIFHRWVKRVHDAVPREVVLT